MAFEPARNTRLMHVLSTRAVLILAVCAWSTLGFAIDDRGYQPRACGFDMNRNGVVGEAADCNVCDGVTTDPDGDGQDEDLIYVDCDGGTNRQGCGSPASPCASITYAYNSIADGVGEEDIVCFRGTCTDEGERVALSAGQAKTSFNGDAPACPAGTYRVSGSGNQVRDFCYPHDPAMIVGWDTDDDGRYPPFDTDDLAVIDGQVNDFDQAFVPEEYMELAHFSVRDYGRDERLTETGDDRGFLAPVRSFSYFHDLELAGINENSCQTSGTIVFSFFGPSQEYVAIENVEAEAYGGYFVRGSAAYNTGYGPLRFQNISANARGMHERKCSGGSSNGADCLINDDCPGGSCPLSPCGGGSATVSFMKLWGWFDGIEVLDNHLECDLLDWHGMINDNKCGGIVVDGCTRDWEIANNLLDTTAAVVQGSTPEAFCANDVSRTVDDVVIDRNEFRWQYALCSGDGRTPCLRDADCAPSPGGTCSASGIFTKTAILGVGSFGNSDGEYLEDLAITNNTFFVETPDVESYVLYNAAGAAFRSGKLTIAGNTFYGDNSNSDAPYFSGEPQSYIAFHPSASSGYHQDVEIKNNIFTGASSADCRNLHFRYPVSQLDSDFNVVDNDCGYHYAGSGYSSLSSWQTATGGAGRCGADGCDSNSQPCDPSFVDLSRGDLHLLTSDQCASGRGTDISDLTPFDLDKESRPQRVWDIGADEVSEQGSGQGESPPPPVNLRPGNPAPSVQ